MKTIKITDKHLQDLVELIEEKDAISSTLVDKGQGYQACDMNEATDALRDLVELAN